MNQTETQVASVKKRGNHRWVIWCMDRWPYYLWDESLLSKLQMGFHVQIFYQESEMGFRSIKDVRLLTPVKPKFSEEDQRDLDLMCGRRGRYMTIDEAIRILEDLDTTLPQSNPEDRREAVKMGIEALMCGKKEVS